ncbi:MAG: serine protease HtrA [Calditrichia bacterium]
MDTRSKIFFLFITVFLAGYAFNSFLNKGDIGSSDKEPSILTDTAIAQNQIEEKNERLRVQRQNAITEVVKKINPAVVGINVIQLKRYVQRSPFYMDDPLWRMLWPELFQNREYVQKVRSLGSGFIISRDGYVVTNEHVVENAAKVIVTTTDGEKHEAEIVGADKVSDIALLKIDGENFPFIPFGNSDDVLVGEWVVAFGNPFGLFELNDEPTVTVGVISATDRDWGKMDASGRIYLDMIQTDAAINSGNSGGPLVNVLGECIGVNTFIYTGSSNAQGFIGIGFAIPSNKVNEIISLLKSKGSVDRNVWTGIEVQNLDNITARALGIESQGVIVTKVQKNSPAEKAGIKTEDVIVEIEGKPVTSFKEARSVMENLDLKVGDPLKMKIIRDGKELNVTLILEKIPN